MAKQGALVTVAALALGGYAAARLTARRRRRITFADKVVVITGGSRGLGLLLARRFAAEGAKLVICSRNDDELERAQTDLASRGCQVATVHCDVRLKTDVDALIRTAVETFGGVDVL